MEVKIVNEAILNENEQTIFVQRFIYPQSTYLVFRKPYTSDEQFALSDDAENIVRDVSTWLTEYDPDDDLLEVFALVYLDEEYPPKAEEYPDAAFLVEYDPETRLYSYEIPGGGEYTTSTLQEAIKKGIAILDELIKE